MTERERFIKALRREPIEGHCPTFELVFYLTLEAIGKIHPSQQRFDQWSQMSRAEQKLHMDYMADSYIEVAEKYHHSAVFVHPNPGDFENTLFHIFTYYSASIVETLFVISSSTSRTILTVSSEV